MLRSRFLLCAIILVVLFCAEAFCGDARGYSLAGGDFSVSFSPKNLATSYFCRQPYLQLDYSRLFVGIMNYNVAGVDAVYPVSKNSALAFLGTFSSSRILREYLLSLGITFGTRIFDRFYTIFAGSATYSGLIYDKGEFHNFDPNDPLFGGKSSVADYGFDIAMLALYRWFGFGVVVYNVKKPNLSLVGDEAGKLERTYRTGFSVMPTRVLNLFFAMDRGERFSVSFDAGCEYFFMNRLYLRAGAEANKKGLVTVGAGCGIPVRTMRFDYALLIPSQKELLQTGTTSHHFSISYTIPPKPAYPDLAVESFALNYHHLEQGETLRYSALIKNVGENSSGAFDITVNFKLDDSTITRKFNLKDGLEFGESRRIDGALFLDKAGQYLAQLIVDSENRIREKSEVNNSAVDSFLVSPQIHGDLKLTHTTLNVEELTYLVEEQPIIPIVFFNAGEDRVPERYQQMLRIVASRAIANPSVKLVLFGYIDTLTDPQSWETERLHLKRARAVKELLLSMGIPSNRVEVKESGYLPTSSRAGKRFEILSKEDRARVSDENRRVEIKVEPIEPFQTIKLTGKQIIPPDKVRLLKRLMSENPDLILIVKGYGNERNPYETLARLDSVRNVFIGADSSFESRVALFLNYAENETIYITISPDAIIYHPVQTRFSEPVGISKDAEINEISISAFSGFPIDTYRVEIIDDKGELVKNLVAGNGTPPKSVRWDWYDESGNIVTPDRRYICRLYLKDSRGFSKVVHSDTISVQVLKREIKREHLIIVEFNFDEILPLSDYLESRVYFMAKDIVDRVRRNPLRREIEIVGHTDVIGEDARNKVLSEERALKEGNYIRILMTYLNSLKSADEFFRWLSQSQVKWDLRGLGSSEPFVVRSSRAGVISERLVGDDNLPEGRSINRRVVLQLKEIIKDIKK